MMKFIVKQDVIVGYRHTWTDVLRVALDFLPQKIKSAFKLDGIYLPKKVKGVKITRIGEKAFSRAIGFAGKIVIPNTITIIEDEAFSDTSIGEIVFEEGSQLRYIGVGAFAYCDCLKQANFQELKHLRQVGAKAFSDCYLSQVVIDSDFSDCLQIGECAFKSNILKKVEILSECAIYQCAFERNSIVDLKIPKCTFISLNAFSVNCLVKLDLSSCDNIAIYNEAFSYNEFLEEVILPTYCSFIAADIFWECKMLLPENIKEGLFGESVQWSK